MARTLVVGDVHLGTARGLEVLKDPAVAAQLSAYIADRRVDRLVLLGDTVELRHGPPRRALAIAEPVLRALGGALGTGSSVVLVAGNHDHGLVADWLRRRGAEPDAGPLALDTVVDPGVGELLGRLRRALGPATLEVRYPGVWLRDDVYATHGHYLVRLLPMPTFERLAAGLMGLVSGPLPERDATPDDFEAALAPIYAWADAVALGRGASWQRKRQGATADTWQALTASQRSLRTRAVAAAIPAGIAAANALGLGPLRAELTGGELRRAGLRAMSDVVRRLDVRAEHVLFGHTHRAGPLPGDQLTEWRAPNGARLHNAGSWVADTVLGGGRPDGPYRPGRALELDDEGPPRLVTVLERPPAAAGPDPA